MSISNLADNLLYAVTDKPCCVVLVITAEFWVWRGHLAPHDVLSEAVYVVPCWVGLCFGVFHVKHCLDRGDIKG